MDKEEKIDFKKIEKKWQDKWEKSKIFEVKEGKKKKYYLLEQFPYPSGEGLHIGHSFIYTIGDIQARFRRMNGFNVLYPMGYDSLGLPAENAAIKEGIHPKEYTEKSIDYYSKQQKALGLSYDWSRKLSTHEPEFYKWDQWIFLKMFEKGLAFRKKAPVNWCPKCETVLANEQVHSGKCWRHEDTNVEIKQLEQWFLKITDYAEELADFNKIKEWPDLIKKLQKNWIGKSFGTEIEFEINNEKWPVFTTRPDTIYGVTFMVISAQHPRLMELVTDKQKKQVGDFLKKIRSVSEKEMEAEIVESSRIIQGITGDEIVPFAFPNTATGIDREVLAGIRNRHPFLGLFFDAKGFQEDVPFIVNRIWAEKPTLAHKGAKTNLPHVLRDAYQEIALEKILELRRK